MHLSEQKKGLMSSQTGQGKSPSPRYRKKTLEKTLMSIGIKPGVQGPSQYHPKNTETKGTEADKAAFCFCKGCVGELLQQTQSQKCDGYLSMWGNWASQSLLRLVSFVKIREKEMKEMKKGTGCSWPSKFREHNGDTAGSSQTVNLTRWQRFQHSTGALLLI